MWAARVLLLVPQLVLVPYLIGTIGEAGYGIYVLVWSLMMSIEQLQMSLQSGVVKYSAGFFAQGQIDEVNKIVSSSFVYSILLAFLTSAGIFLAAAFYNDPTGKIASSLVVVGIMVLFIFPLTPYVAVIQSRQRYYVGAIAGTVSTYVSLLAVVVWFKMMRPSVEAVLVIMAGMLFLSRLVQVPVAYRMVSGLQNRPNLFDLKNFRLLTSFGGTMIFVGLCLMANSTGVRWLMGILVSTSFVAHLAIMLMPGLLLSQLIGAVTITVMPATSAYEATGNQRMLQELLIRGMRYTMILALAGLLTAVLLMGNVLSVWVGPDYVFLAPYALALFASISFMLSTSISHHMLKGLGRLRITVFISLMGLVIVPIGLILLVFQIWHNPYVAVTSGLAAGHVVCGCLQIGFCTKAVHVGLRETFVRVYGQPLLAAAVAILPVYALMHYGTIEGLPARLGLTALCIGTFGAQMYFLYASQAERRQACETAQATLRRGRRFFKRGLIIEPPDA